MLGIGTALIQGWSEKEKKCWSLKRESYKDIHTRGIPTHWLDRIGAELAAANIFQERENSLLLIRDAKT